MFEITNHICGLILLAYHVFCVFGLRYIPPVTLLLAGFQTAVYTRIINLPWKEHFDVCVSAINVWYDSDYIRLLYAAFEHGDDWHLYYNMASFIPEGQALEKKLGSVKFLLLTTLFTVATNATFVLLSAITSYIEPSLVYHCAIGFSGVIFAFKVLISRYLPDYEHKVMGIPIMVSSKYAVWMELLFMQMLSNRSCFLGHLAGIIVGYAYIKIFMGHLE